MCVDEERGVVIVGLGDEFMGRGVFVCVSIRKFGVDVDAVMPSGGMREREAGG